MFGIKNKTLEVGIKIGIGAAILLCAHIFAGRRVFQALKQEQESARILQEELKQKQEKIRLYPNPKDEMEKIQADMDKLKEKAVSEKELPKIIQQLTKKSSEMGIEIISIKPVKDVGFQDSALPQGVSKAYIEVVMKVTYKTMGEYFKAMKEMPTTFTIESVAITRFEETAEETAADKKSQEEGGKLMVKLLISSYTIWKL